MATTTNFGWETPDDTDLVKDGALAIRTLGSAIDTSLVDLKGGTTGQVLSKTSNTDMDFTWVTSDDANAIQNAIVDAKGDLIAASAADTPARLAVGNNGETLLADSSSSVGLRWQGNFAAGKNKIINGDFYINQRNFTSNTAHDTFNFDRWRQYNFANSGTVTLTPQVFTPGAAPVAGYEGRNFLQVVTASQTATSDYAAVAQLIEDVRTLAGQTITVSFWAKASSGTPKIAVNVAQNFGSGGSSLTNNTFGTVTISTSWARYSITAAIPSISGKTIGTGSSLELQLWLSGGSSVALAQGIGNQNNTFQIWGVQVEAGSVATAFQTATGTLQGELAACKYYYKRITGGSGTGSFTNFGTASSTTQVTTTYADTSPMRVTPTSIDAANVAVSDINNARINASSVTIDTTFSTSSTFVLNFAVSGATQYRPYTTLSQSGLTGYLGLSAEL